MAIPLSMPNSDDIEDSHRLDLLLEQLLITLRQVLIHRRRAAAAAAMSRPSTTPHVRHRHEPPERTRTDQSETPNDRIEEEREENEDGDNNEDDESDEQSTTRVSADEVSNGRSNSNDHHNSLQFPLPDLVMDSPSVKQCHRATCCRHHSQYHRTSPSTASGWSWMEDGSELMRLAGQLLDQAEVDAKIGAKVKGDEERMNVLSLMCPLLGNSLWTTVALLVVLGLLSHAR